jgi:hypothetical protein
MNTVNGKLTYNSTQLMIDLGHRAHVCIWVGACVFLCCQLKHSFHRYVLE